MLQQATPWKKADADAQEWPPALGSGARLRRPPERHGLDNSAQKAAIRIKVDEASGALQRAREEAQARANAARAEKLGGVPRDSRPPSGGSLGSKAGPVAKVIAEKARVSPRTVERVQKLKREDPKAFEDLAAGRKPHPVQRAAPKNWSVPRAISELAAFLCERLTSTERRELARRRLDVEET